MRNRFLLCMVTGLFVGLTCLSACRTHGLFDSDFQGGETVTPDLLQEISAQVFGTLSETQETTQSVQTTTAPTTPCEETLTREPAMTLAEDSAVLWLAEGSVYHLYEDCPHLVGEKEVIEGSVLRAGQLGIQKFCADCEKRLNP